MTNVDVRFSPEELLKQLEKISNLGALQGSVNETDRIKLLSQVEETRWGDKDTRAKVAQHLMTQAEYLRDIRPWNFEISLSSAMRKAASMAEDTIEFSALLYDFLKPETNPYVKQVALTALGIMGSGKPVAYAQVVEDRVYALACLYINKEFCSIAQINVLGINTIVVLASMGHDNLLDVVNEAVEELKPGTVRLARNLLQMMTTNCWRRNHVDEDHPRFKLVVKAEKLLVGE